VAAFYLPVVILCVVYHRIYRETRRHQRNIYELQAPLRRQLRLDRETGTRSRNVVDETRGGFVGACRKRLASVRLRWCPWRRSGERDGPDRVEESVDEDTPSGE